MFKSRTLLVLVVLVAVCAAALTGCGSQPSNGKALEAHEWKVAKLGSTAYTGGADITAAFSAGTLSGSTGINQYSAKYEAPKGNDISIQLGPMTLVGGSPQAMKAESTYLAALTKATSYAVDDQSLTLFDASGVSLVEYTVDVPVPLVGTHWTMVMYNNGHGGFQGAETSATVTALFAQDGTLSGNGGINQYHATYTSTDKTIKIGPIAATQAAGPENLMAQEAAYFAALEKATTYAMEGDIMTLRDSTGAAMVGYRAAK